MPESATLVERKPDTKEGQATSVAGVTHVNSNHEQVVASIGHNLAQAGFSKIPPEAISAGGEAEAVLADLEEKNPGVELTEDIRDKFKKLGQNIGSDFNGTNPHYSTEGKKGHNIVFERVKDRVFRTKVAEKIHNFLSRNHR